MEDLINRVSQTAATDKLAGWLKSEPANYKLEVLEKERCWEKWSLGSARSDMADLKLYSVVNTPRGIIFKS